MSCIAELRTLNVSKHTLKALQLRARSSQKTARSQAVPSCTQCRTYYATLGLRPAISSQNPLRRIHQSQQHGVRFISTPASQKKHRAFVALGSNMGDRIAMIEQACKEMEACGKIKVLRTSSLWETKAMYVLDQDKFVNGACEVSTIASSLPRKCLNISRLKLHCRQLSC
jgi:2-amino-4-hydroxy-6-hydroxymethyldihydropteridine diphosphokinase/dihydropteroate synthase